MEIIKKEKLVFIIGIVVASFISFQTSKANEDAGSIPAPDTDNEYKVIDARLPSLVSFNGEVARAKIVVENKSKELQKYKITYNDKSIEVDPESSCYKEVLSGGICEFDIKYIGNKASPKLVSVESTVFRVVGNADNNEKKEVIDITIQKVDVGAEAFFDPSATRYTAKKTAEAGNSFRPVIEYKGDFLPNRVMMGMSGSDAIIKHIDSSIAADAGCTIKETNQNGVNVRYTSKTNRLYRSTNDVDWYVLNGRLPNENIRALRATGGQVYAGTDDGVFESNNEGASWVEIGLAGKKILSLYLKDGYLYAGTEQGVFKYRGNINWDVVGGVESIIVNKKIHALSLLGDYLFAGTDDGVYKINLKMGTWEISESIKNVEALHKVNGCIYATSAEEKIIKRSCDGEGKKWENVSADNRLSISRLYSMNNNLYAGTNDGEIYKLNEDKWKKISPIYNKITNSKITALYSYPLDDCLYVGVMGESKTDKRVFKTCDDGNIWNDVEVFGIDRMGESLYKYQNIYPAVLSMYATDKFLYIGTDGQGVFKMLPAKNKSDDGVSWGAEATAIAVITVTGYGIYRYLHGMRPPEESRRIIK